VSEPAAAFATAIDSVGRRLTTHAPSPCQGGSLRAAARRRAFDQGRRPESSLRQVPAKVGKHDRSLGIDIPISEELVPAQISHVRLGPRHPPLEVIIRDAAQRRFLARELEEFERNGPPAP
jgi:hypothetical protein